MSFLSAACQTCKSRHLKCDEVQPVCGRCKKSKRTCYRAEPIIHIENAFANRQKKRPRGPRPGPADTRSSVLQPTLPKTLALDLKTVACTYYLHKHLHTIPDLPKLMRNQSDDATQMWMAKQENPLLELSISTMSLAVFSRVHKHSKAALEASSHYQKLLRTARVELTAIDSTNIDTALLATFFMGRYEDSMHLPEQDGQRQSFAATLKSVPHHEGATTILKIWADQLSATQPASDVIKHSRQGMIRSALLRNRPIPDWMADGALFGERDLELEYDRVMVRLANLRYQVTMLCGRTQDIRYIRENEAAIASQLSQEAQDIDNTIHHWARHFPSAWRPQRHNVVRELSKSFRTSFVNTYTNPAFAAIWNRVHVARMLVNSTCMDVMLYRKLACISGTEDDHHACLSNIELAANELAANLPFMLQRVNVAASTSAMESSISLSTRHDQDPEPYVASMVAWPLSIASSLKYLKPECRQWFRSELGAIGGLLGNRVFESVKNDQWLEL